VWMGLDKVSEDSSIGELEVAQLRKRGNAESDLRLKLQLRVWRRNVQQE